MLGLVASPVSFPHMFNIIYTPPFSWVLFLGDISSSGDLKTVAVDVPTIQAAQGIQLGSSWLYPFHPQCSSPDTLLVGHVYVKTVPTVY